MIYPGLAILTIIVAVLLLNFRVRFRLGRGQRLLFIGLGRTGPEFDFAESTGRVRLFGINIKSFTIGKEDKAAPKKEKPPKPEKAAKKKKPGRKRPLRDILKVAPGTLSALWSWFLSLLKVAVIEELEGEIEAGFDSPDMTGTVFGYYQAAIGAVPLVATRVRFTPDWTGASFAGSVKGSMALPVYKIVWRTMVMIFRLPLRDFIKLAIGKRRGGQDGKQRS